MSVWVETDVVVWALSKSGLPITAHMLRNWVHRGHVHRDKQGRVDLAGIKAYLQGRGLVT